jgi:hypothetical protein
MRAKDFVVEDLGILRKTGNWFRNIGRDSDAPIKMMTNPKNQGAVTGSGKPMDIKDFPLQIIDIKMLKPWEPMIKMQDLPSQRNVASMVQKLRQGQDLPPLLVTPVRGGYRIIDGHHRYAAYQRAEKNKIPVRVVDPKLIRYSDEVMEALRITLRRYGHLRNIGENFADGKKPGRRGLAKRMKVPAKASVSRLRQIAKKSSGERARMAHWLANMKAGRKKKSR